MLSEYYIVGVAHRVLAGDGPAAKMNTALLMSPEDFLAKAKTDGPFLKCPQGDLVVLPPNFVYVCVSSEKNGSEPCYGLRWLVDPGGKVQDASIAINEQAIAENPNLKGSTYDLVLKELLARRGAA